MCMCANMCKWGVAHFLSIEFGTLSYLCMCASSKDKTQMLSQSDAMKEEKCVFCFLVAHLHTSVNYKKSLNKKCASGVLHTFAHMHTFFMKSIHANHNLHTLHMSLNCSNLLNKICSSVFCIYFADIAHILKIEVKYKKSFNKKCASAICKH